MHFTRRQFGSLALAAAASGAERSVDPTFLYRALPDLKAAKVPMASTACQYKAAFGEGDSQTSIVKGVSRFGEVRVAAGGASTPVSYEREEQIFVVTAGSGTLDYAGTPVPLKKEDFVYVPPGVRHSLKAASGGPVTAILMGFRIPADVPLVMPPAPAVANIAEVKKQQVGNHPASTLYQLLVGDTTSKRDRLATGHTVTSLFIMTIAPGGTNFPHHHPTEEEVYLLMEGEGEMVAGGGMDGVEGKHKAKTGDAYFIRLNATVGFYASNRPGAGEARVLAVRSRYPFGKMR